MVCLLSNGGMFRVNCLALFTVSMLFFVSPPDVNAADSIYIQTPLDSVWVSEKKLFLAGSITTADKHVAVKGVGVAAKKGRVPVEGGGFGSMITLGKGLNSITVSAGKASKKIKVFFSSSGKNIPKGYTRFFVHKNQKPLNCKECHKFRRGKYDFKRIIPSPSNCIKCHTKMANKKHVHGPVGAGVCISCHNPHGSKQKLMMARTGQELCFACHQAKRDEFKKQNVHSPVKDGCVDCHDPHQSPMRFQLRGHDGSVSSLCFTCHGTEMFTKSVQHGPVAEGDCIACHFPHASENSSLLIASPAEAKLCFECHEDRKEDFTMKNVHAPVEEDCSQCHDPHSSEAAFQLLEPGGKLCASCHEDMHPEVYEAKNNAVYKHEPVAQDRCTDCHSPHTSNYAPLLRDRMDTMCFKCHDELGDEVVASKSKHGPVQTGDCAECHSVHGSQYTRLLVRFFPEEFYSEYLEEKYDLCYGCHNKNIAQKKLTTSLTNFRDGDYNLHFFHVNMKKGRSCISCHDAHASTQGKHVRYEVPFGAWSYPIAFTKTKTGGTCVVGCHAPKTYDRKSPRINPSR